MKFLFAAFAGIAAASTIGSPVVKRASHVERDIAAITSVISSISDSTKSLDTAVKGFSGAGQVASLQSASEDLIKILNSGTETVNSNGDLSQSDALALPQPVQDLSDLVKTATDDVVAKKSAFDGVGVGSVVYDQLMQIADAAKKFSDALVSKVPESLQSIATGLADPINSNLAKAVAAYKGDTSSATGSASGSASASATGSASESASASATGSESASASATGGATYPTASASASSGSYTTAPGAATPTNGTGSYTTGVSPPIATGAAAPAAAVGYGVAAVAALAVVAAF